MESYINAKLSKRNVLKCMQNPSDITCMLQNFN